MLLLIPVAMHSSCSRAPLAVALALVVALWGCGSSNSLSGTPTANGSTPAAGGSTGGTTGSTGGSGGGTAGFSDQLAPCGTKNGTASQITGRVIDATTGQPISGKVIANIDPADRGDSINQNLAAADGHWSSANLIIGITSFGVAIEAVSSTGVAYVPKILVPTASCPITQGTDIGTIALSPAPTVNGTVMFTAQTSTGSPALISVELRTVFAAFAGIDWGLGLDPYVLKFREDLQTGAQCPANTACLTDSFAWSASPALAASYAGTSTQFHPVASSAVWSMSATWNNALSNPSVSYHCTPTFVKSSPVTASPGASLNFGTLAFTGC